MVSFPLPDQNHAIPAKSGPNFTPGMWWAMLGWLLCCAVLLWLSRHELASLTFRDPDDSMRLQQVRDWLAGQGFYDVSQHRVFPPQGGPMHWSRIVDAPIAALILILRPLLGTALAETVACAAIPLLLLGALTAALFAAVRRVAGPSIGLLAAALLLITPTILVQFGPLRIDHHGWQIVMATIALGGALDYRAARGGIIAAIAMAIWLQISSEGLPYAALFAAIFALWQWRDRGQTPRFIAYAVTLGGAALPLLALLRGPAALVQQQCDSLSAAYLWPLVAFAIATPVLFRVLPKSASGRFAAAAAGAAAATAIFAFTGGPCLTGDPFKAIGPLAYKLWYLHVMEGRPIWEQAMSMVGLILLPPLAGLVGTIAAGRAAKDQGERDRWIVIALLLIGSTGVAVMVMRAMSVAHIMALPGTAWLIAQLFRRAQSHSSAIVRVLGSAAVAVLTPTALCALWVAITPEKKGNDSPPAQAADCRAGATIAPLRQLPASTLFAPLDMGPDILIRTAHNVTGTAHHRNAAGITAVVEGFTATPDRAHVILARLNGGKGPGYVITCKALNEFEHYAQDHRHSLAAALARGAPPSWLHQLPAPEPLRIYKVMPVRN